MWDATARNSWIRLEVIHGRKVIIGAVDASDDFYGFVEYVHGRISAQDERGGSWAVFAGGNSDESTEFLLQTTQVIQNRGEKVCCIPYGMTSRRDAS